MLNIFFTMKSSNRISTVIISHVDHLYDESFKKKIPWKCLQAPSIGLFIFSFQLIYYRKINLSYDIILMGNIVVP